jgi:hypothetical protein
MPAAALIPAVVGLAGGAMSALGGSGKQGSVSQSSTQNTTQNTTMERLEKALQEMFSSNTSTPIEPEYMSAFRQSLIPGFQNLMGQAGKPVYGKAQTANFMQGLNDLTNGAMDNLKQTLAKAGALDSGRFGQGAAGLQMNRLNQATNFMGQLPFMEKQAQIGNLGNVLGMGMNWAGRAPVGMQQTGFGTQQSTGSMTGNQNTTGTSNSTGQGSQYGPSFGSSFLNSLGGMFAAGGKGPFGGIFRGLMGMQDGY